MGQEKERNRNRNGKKESKSFCWCGCCWCRRHRRRRRRCRRRVCVGFFSTKAYPAGMSGRARMSSPGSTCSDSNEGSDGVGSINILSRLCQRRQQQLMIKKPVRMEEKNSECIFATNFYFFPNFLLQRILIFELMTEKILG